MKVAVLALAVLLAILWRAPAAMVDFAVRRASGNEVRVVGNDGTLWRGHGTVEVIDRSTRIWQPWRSFEWTFDWAALLRARPTWHMSSGRSEVARLDFSPGGWRVAHLSISGPARYFWQRLPHDVGRFGWAGDLAIESPEMACSWQSRCSGHIEVRWLNAGSDFLPERVFGDYLLQADGTAGDFQLSMRTLAGAVRIEGRGQFPAQGKISLQATVTGDPALLQRLTAVAGPWAKPTGSPGVWAIAY